VYSSSFSRGTFVPSQRRYTAPSRLCYQSSTHVDYSREATPGLARRRLASGRRARIESARGGSDYADLQASSAATVEETRPDLGAIGEGSGGHLRQKTESLLKSDNFRRIYGSKITTSTCPEA
jgi:hypothetical protein